MKTEDLINALAAEAAPAPAASVETRVGLALPLAVLVSVVLYFLFLGPRPDLAERIIDPVVAAKTLLPLGLAMLALVLALRSARPAVPLGLPARVVWLVPAIALGLFVWAFVTTAPDSRFMLWQGKSIPVCLPMIVILSLPLTAGMLAAMRRGASVRPGFSGALAGLAAAGLATTIYSTFCNEDSPLFYATWYSLGILLATLIGALAGSRLLRW
ncbi:DUF1109 domain-containing protein [Pseudooceanicola sp.]|uniref:DUF1109 domain-containing protein n=1 Tax=Pseudooceanicola sp. TaxID=1914328 RepID=UPI00260FFCB5|nr:DUF1109 domain-containing protein [Pseudooceanicola sp.]MDF1854003.1 DUF1109 domain-containing protein [Pseudooceanicola sp.]